MATEGIKTNIPGLTTVTDLSADQYCFVKMSADNTVAICAAATDCPVGVLDNSPKANQEASVICAGVAKVKAGGAIAAGGRVGTDANGHAVALSEGVDGTKFIVGQALQAAVNGDIFSVLLSGTPHRAA